jgi:hypothetical protein
VVLTSHFYRSKNIMAAKVKADRDLPASQIIIKRWKAGWPRGRRSNRSPVTTSSFEINL